MKNLELIRATLSIKVATSFMCLMWLMQLQKRIFNLILINLTMKFKTEAIQNSFY